MVDPDVKGFSEHGARKDLDPSVHGGDRHRQGVPGQHDDSSIIEKGPGFPLADRISDLLFPKGQRVEVGRGQDGVAVIGLEVSDRPGSREGVNA